MRSSDSAFASSSSSTLDESYHYRNIISPPRQQADQDDDLASLTSLHLEQSKARAGLPGRAPEQLFYRTYQKEEPDLYWIMELCDQELSEPYNLYTFRYFLQDWPHLTFLVFPDEAAARPIGTIVCKQEMHRTRASRGYIAMLSVDRAWRRRASELVRRALEAMKANGGDEVILETEFDNATSIALYEHLGFIREKRLHRFYSNGKDAYRLILPLKSPGTSPPETAEEREEGRWAVRRGPDDLDQGLAPISEEDRYFPPNPPGGLPAGGRNGDTPRLPPSAIDEWYT